MKKILTLFALIPVFAWSQKVALIDRGLKQPVVYVQKLEMKHITNGYFTMQKDDMKKVVANLKSYRALIEKGADIPENMKSTISGATYFAASGDKGDYTLVIDTKIDKMGSYYILADKKDSKKKNLARIDEFIDYLAVR